MRKPHTGVGYVLQFCVDTVEVRLPSLPLSVILQ